MAQRGFSLMEVMVALVIFAMISVGAFGVLTQLQRSKVTLEERSAELETLQRVNLISWHDISQATPHTLALPGAASASVQLTADGLTFTSFHWPNPMQEPRSNLASIRYDREGDALVRQVWPLTAGTLVPATLHQTLAGHVTNVSFRSIETVQKSSFPAAIEMTVTLPPFGDVIQLVPLVQAP